MADDETGLGEARDGFVDGEVELLLLRLLHEVVKRASVPPAELSVVLELKVDGLRCITLIENAESTYGALSPREQEIARMVGAGYPNKTIAARLGISSWTVSTHLRRMFAKVGVNSRAALVARVLEEELVFDERRIVPRSSP
ncbi:MAG: helix-turn-helix domain-containing protein [Gaiellaceae bacterium]